MTAAYPGGKGSAVLLLDGRGLDPSVTVLVLEAASAAELEEEAATTAGAAAGAAAGATA